MNQTVDLFTIGFTQKSAEHFFDTLKKNQVKVLIDTRRNNVSQLAGFAKKNDLKYFLDKICGIEYVHMLDLAPTQDILDDYKKKNIDWASYEKKFLALIHQRRIEDKITPDALDRSCLLCSEAKPHQCHRRLVAEYLQGKWNNIGIHHL